MKKSAFISDIIFAFLVSALLSLCIFRYLGAGARFSLLLALLCGGLTACSVGALLQSKRKSFFLKRSDEAQKVRLLTHLALLSDKAKTVFFEKTLLNESAKSVAPLKVQTQDAVYFLRFRFSPVSADEIARLSRLKTSKKKIVLCDRIDDNAVALADCLGVEYQTAESVYKLVKDNDALPKEYLGEEVKEDKRKRKLKIAFSKKNSKRFFLSGALILTASLFTPFPYYYLIFGCILTAVAIFVRIFGYRA